MTTGKGADIRTQSRGKGCGFGAPFIRTLSRAVSLKVNLERVRIYAPHDARARVRVTYVSRERHDHERNVGVNRTSRSPKDGRDEGAGSQSPLAANSPSRAGTVAGPGNPRCRICGRPSLYHPDTIARGICASCWQKERTA